MQALVFESSPPIITIALILSALQFCRVFSNCSSVSSFVLPEPIMSKPPVFLYLLINSSSNLTYLLSIIPEGPPKNPYKTLLGLAALSAS